MSVKDLYWRELEFDNSKRYSWVFHNYAVIINAEVLIHIAKADAPAPNNDSPYFTIPFSSYRDDIRTEPGDKIYYTTRNGGELAYHYGEINETHNYDIPTEHTSHTISGEKTIIVPEGAMVSLQANPERNGKDTFIKYRLGDRDRSGEFRLYGAQQVAYTFTTETEITFFSENDFFLDVLITASQNVSQLSKDMQDKIDKLVADLKAAMENMATKDMLQKVFMKTKRDNFILLPNKAISNGVISSNFFYNKYSDTESEVTDGDIITAEFYIDLVSSDQDIIKDTRGVIELVFNYSSTECKVISFLSTHPELTKITSLGSFVINSTTATSDMEQKWQRMEIKLNIKEEYTSILNGTTSCFVKSNNVPLRSENESIVFDDVLNNTFTLNYENLFQNVAFMKEEDVELLIERLSIGKRDLSSSFSLSRITKGLTSASLPKYTIETSNGGVLNFELSNDANYHLSLRLNTTEYPILSQTKLKPFVIEIYEDSITGESFLVNLIFVSVSESIAQEGNNITYSSVLKPLVKRDFDYIEKMLEYLSVIKDLSKYVLRVISNDR